MPRAFTLIELLVVVALLALLLGILLPQLAGAREAGRQAVCRSNLRSLEILVVEHAHQTGRVPHEHPDESLRCPTRKEPYVYLLGGDPGQTATLAWLDLHPQTIVFQEMVPRHGKRLIVRADPASVEAIDEPV